MKLNKYLLTKITH